MYKYKNKLTVKKGMKRYVARRSRIIRNNIDVDGGMIKCEEWNTLAKVVEKGTNVTLAQVRKKYKVSKETQKALETLNIF